MSGRQAVNRKARVAGLSATLLGVPDAEARPGGKIREDSVDARLGHPTPHFEDLLMRGSRQLSPV